MFRDRIHRLWVWCQSVVPLTDWASLSVYEALCKVVAKLNEVIENVNTNSEKIQQILDMLAGEIDQISKDLKAYIDAQDAKTLQAANAYSDGRYNQSVLDNEALEKKLSDIIALQVQALQKMIFEGDAASKLYIDTEIIKIKRYLESIETKLPPVINPMTGKLDSISNTLRDIVNAFSYHAFTARQWDEYGLTAGESDGYQMTAVDYQIWAKCITGWYENNLRKYFQVLSPWSGKFIPVQDAIQKLAEYHMQGYTAQALDALDFTAQDYDTFVSGQPVTSYNFSWTNWVNA